jgi:hypothetical protein
MSQPREQAYKNVGRDLPGGNRSSSDLQEEVTKMMTAAQESPGDWLLVASFADDPAKAHRRRESIRKHAPNELDVTVRIPDVYVRWSATPMGTEEGA